MQAPSTQPLARALAEAWRAGRAIPAAPWVQALPDAAAAYAVQELVAAELGWFASGPARHWKSGGPSRDATLTHAPLPPRNVRDGLADFSDVTFHAMGVEAEIALRLGTDDPTVGTRPFVAAFTPDGKRIVVTHFRTNNISIVDVDKALAGQPAEIKRLDLATPNGMPSRPRGVAFTADGRYVAITGAPKGTANSGVVWLVDMTTYAVAGRVTQVGNESYMIGAFRGR